MKKIYFLIIINLLYANVVFAGEEFSYQDISKIQNDKETVITAFDQDEISRIQNKFTNADEKLKITNLFIKNLYTFLNIPDMHCEPKYIKELIQDLQDAKLANNKDELIDIFKMMRVENSIDDVYYDILENLVNDYYSYSDIVLTKKPFKNIFKNYDKKVKGYDLENLFVNFKKYPDESSSCSYYEYFKIREVVGLPSDSIKEKNKQIKDLAYVAYTKDILSLESYNKIKYLSQDSNIQKRRLWLGNYLRVIFSAKNKMIPVKRNYKVGNLAEENGFSVEHIARFSKITRRKLLYQKYDENQIVLLSQVMRKASQRMGVDPDTKTSVPYLIQEFNVLNSNGKTQNYVQKLELDTQDQFNLARKMLRKDMVALQMMDTFLKTTITYEDLVMASLETGYLSLDDIEYVVKYDDLWNPQTSKFQRYMKMTFRVAGYATFFVPPPWNVTAALTLSIIEGIVESKNIDGASNDNPNTIID